MTEKKDIAQPVGTAHGAGARRPWQPPRIISRESLEVIAAACSGPGAKASSPDCDILSGSIRS